MVAFTRARITSVRGTWAPVITGKWWVQADTVETKIFGTKISVSTVRILALNRALHGKRTDLL